MKKKAAMVFLENPVLHIHYDEKNNQVSVSQPEGYQIALNGSDRPQVVNHKLEVCRPLTGKTVHLSFKITNQATGEQGVSVDYSVAIPGRYSTEGQPKPAVIPELAEWHGAPGAFTITPATRVVVPAAFQTELTFAAAAFCDDMKEITGFSLQLQLGEEPKPGDVFFTLDCADSFLGKEGYTIHTDSVLTVNACNKTGAYWATRTLLQMLKGRGDHSVAKGEIRDYPAYAVRGFMFDVGRRPISLTLLRQIIQNMAWFKMNDLQLHLNDNYIWLEDYYIQNKDETDTFEAYEAFRLESSLRNSKGETPTAKDYAYSKAEFRQLIAYAADHGVQVVPEIDVPAHALSFTKAFPEYMVKNQLVDPNHSRPLTDHIDVNRPEAVEFVKQIFDDYTKGDEPVFGHDVPVHIGADEFVIDPGAYRRFFNTMIPHVKETNPARVWGSLTWIKDNPATPIDPKAIEGVQMNLWACNWADGIEMYQMGFDLINTIDHYLYMVPNGTGRKGSYTDFLNKKNVYLHFEPRKVRTKSGSYTALPAGDPRMLGGVYAIWHDNIDKKANGLSETDHFERFYDALPLMSEKNWAIGNQMPSLKEIDTLTTKLGTAPGTNPYYQMGFDSDFRPAYESGKPVQLLSSANKEMQNALTTTGNQGVALKGGASYVKTTVNLLGPCAKLSFRLKLDALEPGQILFEAAAPYGTHDVRITSDGKLGFTREFYEYSFDYVPPVGQEISLEIQVQPLTTTLLIDHKIKKPAVGKFLHNGIAKKEGQKSATFTLPLERIGSQTNAICGTVWDITLAKTALKPKKKWLFWK